MFRTFRVCHGFQVSTSRRSRCETPTSFDRAYAEIPLAPDIRPTILFLKLSEYRFCFTILVQTAPWLPLKARQPSRHVP